MRNKVLAVASGGGHWVQMQRLRPVFEGLDIAYVSVLPTYAEDVPSNRFYAVRDVTRWDRWGIVILVIQLILVLLKERPRVVITTGSAPGVITLALAKILFRCKTMWIDSIANYQAMSSSGRQARRFSDVWLTQWPHLEQPDGPACWGAVF